ncbi:MAG: VWA domain-containing protein [Cellvibrionaceae bacterium]
MIRVFLQVLSSPQSVISRCLLLCLVTAFSVQIGAQVPEAPKPSDVRIVIDISGSMKKNDPQNLRRPALDMLVKLLPEGSKAGVWTFGQYVNMLVKHRPVDKGWKQEADSKQQSINSVAQFTNIGEALEKAAYDKSYSTKDQFQTHVILLTDGMVDINRDPNINTKERNRILNDVLPVYKKAGYTIHTISLSDKADKKLMDRLALATNGKSTVAKTADELMSVFLQVFDQAVPKEELPLEGNTFATDSSIEEFTALIFRKPGSPETRLLTPDQKEYSQSTVDPNLNWYRTDKYDLITIKRPLEGEWRVLAELEPQSRITVVSDLSLVVKPISANLMANDKVDLSLALREDNKVVSRAEFLELLDIDVDVKHIEVSKKWSKRLSEGLVPGNGVYKTDLDYFSKTGTYEIAVTVDGKSFKRRYKHQVNVREPFAIETATVNKDGKTLFKVTVIPQNQSIDFDKTEVVGKLKDPLGSSQIKNFTYTNEQAWELFLTPDEEGIYYLTLRITTTNERGEAKNIIPKPLSFKYPQADGVFETLVDEEPEPVVIPPAPVEEEPKEDVVEEDIPEEELLEEEEPETDYTQWILYAVLGIVNILIILVIYILYRKLFGGSPKIDDDESEDMAGEAGAGGDASAPPAFEEPPMDEMAIDDLDDDDIDLAEEPPADPELDLSSEDEDPLAGLTPEALDDDDAADEDPEFSLDDFAPDALDDDEEEKK